VQESAINRDSVKSAVRALEIFELFAKLQRPLPLYEIVEHLDYPQSSATKLLKSIVDQGYLVYSRTERTYFPTLKVHAIGAYLQSDIGQAHANIMSALHSLCQETIMIASQNDLYIQYLKVVDSDHVIRFNIEENSMRPLIESSLGWMLLSAQDERAIERVYKQSIAIGAQSPVSSFHAFMQGIEACRRQNYCYVRGMPLAGGGSISMLLPPRHGGQQMVLAVGGVCDRLEPNMDKILSEMRRLLAELR
jgi:DNA-binding IclR family transcriptional regulator